MFEIVVYTDRFSLIAGVRHLLDAPERLLDHLEDIGLPKTQKRVNLLLNRNAPPVSLPFEFATDRSRNFYFANFDEPYQRTGFVRLWEVRVGERTATTILVRLENDAEYAPYVFGPRQVPGHEDTGWGFYPEVIERGELAEDAWVEVGQIWLEITNDLGMVG